MFKSVLFREIEVYAPLDLKIAYEELVKKIKEIVCKRCNVECDEVEKYILKMEGSIEKIQLSFIFDDILLRIKKEDFSYEMLMEAIVELDNLFRKNICTE